MVRYGIRGIGHSGSFGQAGIVTIQFRDGSGNLLSGINSDTLFLTGAIVCVDGSFKTVCIPSGTRRLRFIMAPGSTGFFRYSYTYLELKEAQSGDCP
jgi:hypothetical protein